MKSYKIYKDSSLLTKEIYVKRSQLPKKRTNSTFNVKKVLKDRELDVSNSVINIVFSSGLANSLTEAKHIILNGDIELNNKVVIIPYIKLKSGDILRSRNSKTLLNYYNRRWSMLKFTIRRDYIKYKYLLCDKKVHRLSYNIILWL